jgi:hypothetical protein
MPKTISIKLQNPDGTFVTTQVPATRFSIAVEEETTSNKEQS